MANPGEMIKNPLRAEEPHKRILFDVDSDRVSMFMQALKAGERADTVAVNRGKSIA
jgi:hypothetical protein